MSLTRLQKKTKNKKKMIIIIVVVRDWDLSALPLLRVSYQLLFVRTIGLADNLNSRYG